MATRGKLSQVNQNHQRPPVPPRQNPWETKEIITKSEFSRCGEIGVTYKRTVDNDGKKSKKYGTAQSQPEELGDKIIGVHPVGNRHFPRHPKAKTPERNTDGLSWI